MSRFFFNVCDGEDLGDEAGLELPDLDAVRSEAIKAAGELLRELGSRWDGGDWVMRVTDERGRPVYNLRFTVEPL